MSGVMTNMIGKPAAPAQTITVMPRLDAETKLRSFAARGRYISMTYAVVMLALHFGFILLIAYDKDSLSILLAPGLSLAMVLGALLVAAALLLTFAYVHWSNGREHPLARLIEATRQGAAR